LRGFDVKYFAASVDAPEVNARFAKSLELDFPILSDPTKTVARAYRVLAPSRYASRRTFYIGVDGHIQAIDTNVSAGSHGQDMVKQLSMLKSQSAGNPER
jgi:peroxiredoxin Q/BCP